MLPRKCVSFPFQSKSEVILFCFNFCPIEAEYNNLELPPSSKREKCLFGFTKILPSSMTFQPKQITPNSFSSNLFQFSFFKYLHMSSVGAISEVGCSICVEQYYEHQAFLRSGLVLVFEIKELGIQHTTSGRFYSQVRYTNLSVKIFHPKTHSQYQYNISKTKWSNKQKSTSELLLTFSSSIYK